MSASAVDEHIEMLERELEELESELEQLRTRTPAHNEVEDEIRRDRRADLDDPPGRP